MTATFASPEKRETLLERAAALRQISISHEDVYRLRHLLTGYHAPMTELLDPSTWHTHARGQIAQLARLRRESTTLGIPSSPVAALDVGPENAEQLCVGDSVALRDPEGVLMAIVELTGIGTETGALYGSLVGVDDPLPIDFARNQLTPVEIHAWSNECGHDRFVALNASRLPDQRNLARIQKMLEASDIPVLYNLFVDARDLGVYRSRPWIAAHQALVDRLPAGSRLNVVALDARLLNDSTARSWIFSQFSFAAGAEQTLDECITEHEHETGIAALRSDTLPRSDIVPRACVPLLQAAFPAPHRQGFTVFFTGLSGSGKSTIANQVRTELLSRAQRPVSMLDGDLVRQHLSSELGFSREHRITNVLRIGYVASEITRHGGIAICAPIAPYQQMRREVRDMVSQYGGFIEVHVATSFEQCEQRDVKGLYARARAGLIKDFTGLDDPYEEPTHPELRLETVGTSPEACAELVIQRLTELGYLLSD
jgi:adenylyl-sulfate kinase